MGEIVLLPDNQKYRSNYLNTRLPDKYMEDFTLLGFTVEPFAKALELLDKANYPVSRQDNGAQVIIKTVKDLQNICEIFMENNLQYEYGDQADTIYQA